MPFGLCNTPATFSRLMNLVLGGLNWTRCLCYLDDVIVFGSTFEIALRNLKDVFECLRKANLKLKPKKCTLFQTEVAYLGHRVSKAGISCDPKKISAVQKANSNQCYGSSIIFRYCGLLLITKIYSKFLNHNISLESTHEEK